MADRLGRTQIKVMEELVNGMESNRLLGDYLRRCRVGEELDARVMAPYAADLDAMFAYFQKMGDTWAFKEFGKNFYDPLYDKAFPDRARKRDEIVPEVARRPEEPSAAPGPPAAVRKTRPKNGELDEKQFDSFVALVNSMDYVTIARLKRLAPGEPFDDNIMKAYGNYFEGKPRYFRIDENGNVSFTKPGKPCFESQLDMLEWDRERAAEKARKELEARGP